jgi:hypothetical protein
MTPMTRRTLIRRSAATAAFAALGGGGLAPALASEAPGTPAALFVFDARFMRSAVLAHNHRLAGAQVLDPRVADLGIAWRGQIAALLQQGLPIEGLTLWSDRLISEIFAREAGVPFHSAAIASANSAASELYHWRVG